MPQSEIGNKQFHFFMIHIGQLIRIELERQERTPAWLARKINCARPNVYYIFASRSLNTELLLRISQALHHDFFGYYSRQIDCTDKENP